MFIGAPYTGRIMEGSPPDNFVVAVTATDPDLRDSIAFAIEEGEGRNRSAITCQSDDSTCRRGVPVM